MYNLLSNFIAEWYWWCFIHPILLKILSVVCGILSVAIVWSEVTFFIKQPVVSIFALVINAAKYHNNYVMIQVKEYINTYIYYLL